MRLNRSVSWRSVSGRWACALAVAGGSWLPMQGVTAAEAWKALPAETVAALRVPDLDGFVTRLRAETRLGRQILSEQRFEALLAAVQEANAADWEEMVQDLGRAGFTLEEVQNLLRQPFGVALVAEPRPSQASRMVGLGWVKMSDDQIQRLLAAQERSLEENADADTRRVDLELAGRPVRQISSAERGSDEAGQKSDETHILLTHLPGGLVVAVGFPQSAEQVVQQRQAGVAEESIDWDRVTDVASVQAVLARFLASQQSGSAGGFVSGLAHRGPAGSVVTEQGEGSPLLSGFVDLTDVFALIRQSLDGHAMAEQLEVVWEISELLGISGLGSLGWQAHLQNQNFQVQTALELVGEARGLVRGLIENPVANEPPAWVSTDVAYSHVGFDLRVLYDAVREAVQKIGGDEAMASLEMANGMVQATTQADIPTILAAMGTAHRFVVLPGREVEQTVSSYNFETGATEEVQEKTFTQPVAVVWELADAEVWERVYSTLVMLSSMQGEMIQSVQEQNFRGLQLDLMGQTISLMFGRGHLVLGIGQEATTQVVTLLNHPAEGAASMLRSEMMQDGRKLLDLKARALSFSLQDGGQLMVDFFRGLRFGFDAGVQEALVQGAEADLSPETRARFKSLIPGDEELRAAVGAMVSQVEQVSGGIRFDSATRLPAE